MLSARAIRFTSHSRHFGMTIVVVSATIPIAFWFANTTWFSQKRNCPLIVLHFFT